MMHSVWKPVEKRFLQLITIVWMISSALFWVWWFQLSHVGTSLGFILTSMALGWAMLLPGYCLFFVQKMKHPALAKIKRGKYRVAMVVTKAPSEPLTVVQKTLLAAKAQTYPHDTWVADEDPTEEALIWYKKNGIKLSCRKNAPDYHNYSWPRRTKCKEGNLAYFYDHYGYKKYDIVAQLGADHVPSKDYLNHILAPFTDESVGYVAAPSICDANANTSWAARARLNSEAMFHGPIQAGTNAGWVPICIGSHYAVRTKALKEIGGIGPELAEDYSTTVAMNAYGWRGVLAYDAVAHGDGPNTFEDLIVQDYQWSRSLVTLLITFYRKYWNRLSLKSKIQFTFTQLWYPVSSFVWLVSILLPVSALLSGIAPVKVNLSEFFVFATIPQLTIFILFLFVRYKKHLRPQNVKLYSWENALFELARWPWVLAACIDAVIVSLFKIKITFKVTSKNKSEISLLSVKRVAPYFVVILVNLYAMMFGYISNETYGYFIFTTISTVAYLVLILLSLSLHMSESVAKKVQHVINHSRVYAYSFILLFALMYLFASQSDPRLLKQKNNNFISSTHTVYRLPKDNIDKYIVVTARYGDSPWTLSKKAVVSYAENENLEINEKQLNFMTSYVSKNVTNLNLRPGDSQKVSYFLLEKARQKVFLN